MSSAADLNRMVLEAPPIVARVVGSRLRTRVHISHGMFRSNDDAALEACSITQVRLLAKFRRVLDGKNPDAAIRSFADYVARAAHSSVNEVLRAHSPQREWWARRIRRVLKKDARFAIWESGSVIFAGLSAWDQDRPAVSAETLGDRSAAARRDRLLGTSWGKSKDADWELMTAIVERVLQLADGPVERYVLVGFIVDLVGVPGRMLSLSGEGGEDDENDEPAATLAAPAELRPEALAIGLEETTNRLRRFWRCCTALKRAAKTALLLNLPGAAEEPATKKPTTDPPKRVKKTGGRAEVAVLRVRGIASIEEIGRQLDLTPAQYSKLAAALGIEIPVDDATAPIYYIWNHLPIRDAILSAALGKSADRLRKTRERALERLEECMGQSDSSHIPARRPSVRAGD